MSASAFARADLDIVLTLRSPFMFQGLRSPLLGIDVSHLRDEAGLPIIPGDQVRGVLRASAKLLGREAPAVLSADTLLAVFGPEATDTDDEVKVKRTKADRLSDLIVTDLVATSLTPWASGETTRIEIDDDLGAAKTGHIVVAELVAPFGDEIAFRGKATLFAPPGRITGIVSALSKALRLMPSIGAFKTAGFGEVIAEKSSIALNGAATDLSMPALPKPQPATGPLFYRVTFDRPLIVDAEWVADNAFEGAAVIPGAVFKGALAQRLRRGGIDPASLTFLSHLRFAHAFPEAEGGQIGGLALPLSLVAAAKDDKTVLLGDALDVPMGRGALLDKSAALFVPDWKAAFFSAAKAELGLPDDDEPRRIPRTHTAIDEHGAARDQMLFTTIARSHLDENKAGRRGWILRVDPATSMEGAALLALVEAGLDGIGKTNARATFEAIPSPPANAGAVAPMASRPRDFALVLRSPAMIVDPLAGRPIADLYRAYFATVCPEADLASFFAQQRMAGRYAAKHHRPYGGTYYPFVLTEPGSVFLLRAKPSLEGALRQRLESLLASGLPLTALGDAASPLDWRNCPYVPENGFGAFTADYLSKASHAALLGRVEHA